MKIAIISDIHSNLEALTTALQYIEAQGIQKIICLGDIVGYGPNPNECVQCLIDKKIPALLGNHDDAVNNLPHREQFSETARDAIRWTDHALTKEHKIYLSTLPLVIDLFGQTFVHASPLKPETFSYVRNYADAAQQFRGFSTPLCFIGHTHRPEIFCDDVVTQTICAGKKFIVNVGSIGQPRNGDPRLCFGLFDTEKFTFDFVCLSYDIHTTQNKIYKTDLPKKLGDRLLLGI